MLVLDLSAGSPAVRAEEGTVTIAVIGDSLADGVWAGLYRAFRSHRDIRILRETVNSSGFTAYEWHRELTRILEEHEVDALVVMVGVNDRQRMVVADARRIIRFNTGPWHRIYEQRLRRFMARLRDLELPTVWVGLPVLRDDGRARAARMLNAIYHRLALEYRLAYASIWDLTIDEEGNYAPYFEDPNGRRRRFRLDDGIHFTARGYGMIAAHVIAVMRARYPGLLPPDTGN